MLQVPGLWCGAWHPESAIAAWNAPGERIAALEAEVERLETAADNAADVAQDTIEGLTKARDSWMATAMQKIKRCMALEAEITGLRRAYFVEGDDICQTLGKALGYPWFKDDQDTFPNAVEADGVCVGEHVAASIAGEAASRITALEAALRRLLRCGDQGTWGELRDEDVGPHERDPRQSDKLRQAVEEARKLVGEG